MRQIIAVAVLFLCTLIVAQKSVQDLRKGNKDFTFSVENVNDFNNYVSSSSKDFTTVLLITVGQEYRSQCQFCGQFRKVFGLTSAMYNKQQPNHKIYFAVLEYKQSTQHLAQQLQIKSVPSVLLYKPKTSKPIVADLQTVNIHDFVQQQTNVGVNIEDVNGIDPSLYAQDGQQQPGQQQQQGPLSDGAMRMLGLVLFVVLLGMIGYTMYSFSDSKIMAFIGLSFFIYIICVGGLVYNMINEPPLFYPQAGGGIMIFLPQQQAQLGLEGYLASFTMIVCAMCIIALTQWLPSFENEQTQLFVGFFLISVLFVGGITLVSFFLMKNSWYMVDTSAWPYIAILRAALGFK